MHCTARSSLNRIPDVVPAKMSCGVFPRTGLGLLFFYWREVLVGRLGAAHSEQQRRQLVDVKGAPPGADVCRGTSSPTEGARPVSRSADLCPACVWG